MANPTALSHEWFEALEAARRSNDRPAFNSLIEQLTDDELLRLGAAVVSTKPELTESFLRAVWQDAHIK